MVVEKRRFCNREGIVVAAQFSFSAKCKYSCAEAICMHQWVSSSFDKNRVNWCKLCDFSAGFAFVEFLNSEGKFKFKVLSADERFMTIMRDSPSLHAFRAVTRLTVYRAPQVQNI